MTAHRLNTVEITVDIQLQKCRGMIGRPTRGVRLNSIEAEVAQPKLVDENIDSPNWVAIADIVVEQIRK